ncbi:unnamed protein product [Brachionus calyciflorus]|uniref:Uncharacterized protein n=1 Tax=Brachionus calyciflorus TaxID=104777 RepID=A0A813M5F7_9BILA|nr:unnamed protein product [Brachionus calyciflorus]
MKTQISLSSQTINLNTNKTLDELNSFLMSHLETDEKNPHNLTNLRDVLKAAHNINHVKNNQENNLNLLIEFLKLDSNNNQINTNNTHSIQTENIINRIENDLQESLKLLKQYNEKFDLDKSDLSNDIFSNNSDHSCKLSTMNNCVRDENKELSNEDLDDTPVYNFNRNDIIRKNFFNKNENLSEKLRKLGQINKKNSISETSKLIEESPQITHRDLNSPVIRKSNQRRNSFDQAAFTEYTRPTTLTKSSTAQFNNISSEKTKIDIECKQLDSGFWNYDELNDLKQKFMSLLGDSNKPVQELKNHNIQSSRDFCCVVDNQPNRLSSMSFVALDNKPISSTEQLKIESFYRSFGTSLFISQSCASLYTVQNSKIRPQTNNETNIRISIATTHSIQFNSNYSSTNSEINHEILKDIMNNRHQSYVPIYHRGVPLWLLNSGKNPHRPIRQLKFTLAEKGTGFILWQDRIDSNSDFNLYLMKKNDNSIHNVSSYFDSLNLINEIKHEQIESMIMTFKASDKKTTVFMKFDLNTETIKFYEFYKRLIKNVVIDTKQRTKSLPVGVGNANSSTKLKRNSQNRNVSFYNYDYNLLDSGSSPNKSKYKRQSCQIVPENEKIKFKRITKNDISNPCNYKHIISLKLSDKNLHYTLSKLLPNTIDSNISSPSSIGNKSIISPCYSVCSSSPPITPLMANEFSIQQSSRSSFNQDTSNDQSTSSLSNSSLSTILPPPLLGVSNSSKFFELNSYNHKISKQRTVK